jgi:hypothetical protein
LNNKYVNDEILKEILKSAAISVITSALFTVIINLKFLHNDFEDAFKELVDIKLPFVSQLQKRGLIEFENEFPLRKDVYEKDIIDSKDVTIIMDDAKRFFSNYITIFRTRFSRQGKTDFIFLDTAAKDSVSVLTRKNGYKEGYFNEKIDSSINELKFEKESAHTKHEITVYANNIYTAMEIILTDKYAMIGLFRLSRGKDDVPHFVFEKNINENCEYNKIFNDVKRLKEYLRIIEPFPKPSGSDNKILEHPQGSQAEDSAE